MKKIRVILLAICTCLLFVSCENDNGINEPFSTEQIEGNYVGTLSVFGYSDDPQRAYVTLTRRSSDVVAFSISCENFFIETPTYNLIVSESKGVVNLTSESGYSISGSVSGEILNITFVMDYDTFVFTGKKD